MWIFTVKYQPSGYSGHSNLIFRVNAKTWETAGPKLYTALEKQGILAYIRTNVPTYEAFEQSFDEDGYASWPSGVEIDTVHPDDDHFIR